MCGKNLRPSTTKTDMMSRAAAFLFDAGHPQVHSTKHWHSDSKTKNRRGGLVFREHTYQIAALQLQARLLLSEIQGRCDHSGKYLVRFIACCDPVLASTIASAFSRASAISCGSTLHIRCQSSNKDKDVWNDYEAFSSTRCDGLDLIGLDPANKELHHASFWGHNNFELDDKVCGATDIAGIPTSGFVTITVDQSARSASNRLIRSTCRKGVTIVVVESEQSRSSEIRQCIERLSNSSNEIVGFVFIKRFR